MAVSRDDVRRIAELARIGVNADRLDSLARELSGILVHMDVLQGVPSTGALTAAQDAHAGMPLRSDAPPSVALERPKAEFAPRTMLHGHDAPAMLDGFYLVPRLATHEDAGADA